MVNAFPATRTVAQRLIIGFVGIGNMGSAMATRLLGAGYRLVVCDKNEEAVQRLQMAGAKAATSPAALAATPGLSAIVSMLPSLEHVRQAYLGGDGILSVPSGELHPHLLIDCSTIDPLTAREVAAAASDATLHPNAAEAHDGQRSPLLIDAPVSGGVPGATAGSLTFMCGGEPAAVDAARPLLETMGKRIIYCGGNGTGVTAKLCNNLVLSVSMAAVSEGLALGKHLGLDPHLLSEIFNTSSARCWSSDTYNPVPGVMEGVPSSRGYKGGFSSKLMVKDLSLALKAAEHSGAAAPMAEEAHKLYSQVDPNLDFSAIYKQLYKG
ncbi:putative 3-hydroxyisobutyrate mitochondrial [Micractinium conductrix]|uniref:3-hydroxyisobutyrate dehydrogenase n=1 Tax=Micractinium conductrix TaxID=554055 RepID=A0A2P6VN30_9CHLO|nr:putative 3-hydroxyisobutyrate mitochondrial [Micractinium conductrix]|eukprot:PSC75511.1 putative 3-hydroxyisobutyrate mitochondrial [Micractinium conductrix]